MPRVSPTLEGFRASFRRPSLTLAEITWRWTVGAAGWALVFFWMIEFLDTLPVTRGTKHFYPLDTPCSSDVRSRTSFTAA